MQKKSTAKTKLTPIPLVRDSVAAGFPSPADDLIEEGLNLDDLLIKHRAATYFVRVSGESMIDAGIFDGDILIVDRSIQPHHDHIVIAAIDGELTVKKIHKQGRTLKLIPANIKYKSINIEPNQDFEIWGVVTAVIHRYQ